MEVYTQCWGWNPPDVSTPYTSSRDVARTMLGFWFLSPTAALKLLLCLLCSSQALLAAKTARLSPRSSCSFKSDWKLKPGHLFCRTQYRVDTHVMLKSYQLLKMSFLVKCHRNQCPRVSFKNIATLMDSINSA